MKQKHTFGKKKKKHFKNMIKNYLKVKCIC